MFEQEKSGTIRYVAQNSTTHIASCVRKSAQKRRVHKAWHPGIEMKSIVGHWPICSAKGGKHFFMLVKSLEEFSLVYFGGHLRHINNTFSKATKHIQEASYVWLRGLLYIRCLSLQQQCDLHFCLHLQCVLWLVRPMSGGTSTTMRGWTWLPSCPRLLIPRITPILGPYHTHNSQLLHACLHHSNMPYRTYLTIVK